MNSKRNYFKSKLQELEDVDNYCIFIYFFHSKKIREARQKYLVDFKFGSSKNCLLFYSYVGRDY